MTSSGNGHGLLGYCGMSTIRIFDYVDYQDWRLCGLLGLETVNYWEWRLFPLLWCSQGSGGGAPSKPRIRAVGRRSGAEPCRRHGFVACIYMFYLVSVWFNPRYSACWGNYSQHVQCRSSYTLKPKPYESLGEGSGLIFSKPEPPKAKHTPTVFEPSRAVTSLLGLVSYS